MKVAGEAIVESCIAVSAGSLDHPIHEHFRHGVKPALGAMKIKNAIDVTFHRERQKLLARSTRLENDGLLRIMEVDAKEAGKHAASGRVSNVDNKSSLRLRKIRYAHRHREVQILEHMLNLFSGHGEIKNVLNLKNVGSSEISNTENARRGLRARSSARRKNEGKSKKLRVGSTG